MEKKSLENLEIFQLKYLVINFGDTDTNLATAYVQLNVNMYLV